MKIHPVRAFTPLTFVDAFRVACIPHVLGKFDLLLGGLECKGRFDVSHVKDKFLYTFQKESEKELVFLYFYFVTTFGGTQKATKLKHNVSFIKRGHISLGTLPSLLNKAANSILT